jgi:hypothetical protein
MEIPNYIHGVVGIRGKHKKLVRQGAIQASCLETEGFKNVQMMQRHRLLLGG